MAEQPSPLTPEINTLLAQASVDFQRYGRQLLDAVLGLVKRGAALPLSDVQRAALEQIFRDHGAELSARFAGSAYDVDALKRLVSAGKVPASYVTLRGPSTLTLLYRVGKAYDSASAPTVRGQHAPLQRALKAAREQPLTARDMATLSYIQRRGAMYMRRPTTAAAQGVDRVLTEAEYAKVRPAMERGQREGFSVKRLERELRDATQGTALLNDMERVARTEGMFAVHEGALVTLKDHATRLGMPDPQVYKIVSPGACSQCLRIWGHMSKPRVYRLSEIEGQSNFGRKASEWVATIGPTHPRCTCPPLSIWDPKNYDTIKATVDKIMEDYY